MALNQKTPPQTEPVSLAEIKTHLRLDQTYTDEDMLIQMYLESVRDWCEGYNGRVFVTQTWEYRLDSIPIMPMEFPKFPLTQINSVTITDSTGVITVIDPVNIVIDSCSEPGRIALKDGYSFPSVTLAKFNGFKIEAECGFGTADKVPKRYKNAILLLVGHMYQNREQTVEKALQEIPFGVKALLGLDRMVPA